MQCTGASRPRAGLEVGTSSIGLMQSEGELVARLRDGDELAFVMLMRQYQMPMLRLAKSMVDNDAVAEEAVQDTWMSVVKGIDRFEARSSLKTWLFRILVNRVRSAHADEERRTPRRAPSVDPSFFDSSGSWIHPVVSWDQDIDYRIVADSMAPALRTALDRLPSRQREVVYFATSKGSLARKPARSSASAPATSEFSYIADAPDCVRCLRRTWGGHESADTATKGSRLPRGD